MPPDEHLNRAELESGLDHIRGAPADEGTLKLIVSRPQAEARELLAQGTLDVDGGLAGDNWVTRPSSMGPNGGPSPDAQITVMNARAAALVSGGDDHDRWALAGDQLYVDLDLSPENLPAGARVQIGEALLEVTDEPHLGCGKFARRFGVEALKVVNSEEGKGLRLRGLNARVVRSGTISTGDIVSKTGG